MKEIPYYKKYAREVITELIKYDDEDIIRKFVSEISKLSTLKPYCNNHKNPAVRTVVKPKTILSDSEALSDILDAYKKSTYVCSSCGKIVFPEVEVTNGNLNLHSEKNNYLGKGGRIIRDNICPDCKLSVEGFKDNTIKRLPNGYIGCLKCGTIFDASKDCCPGCRQPRYY